MRPEELPARLWRRRYLRILASRQRKREAAWFAAAKAQPVHPAHERWLKHRAVGGYRCRTLSSQEILDVWQRWDTALRAVPDGPAPTVVIVDDPSPVPLCLRCGCAPGRRDHDCPDPCPCHTSGHGVS